jgi:putative transposase
MARMARAVAPGFPHHVIQRGNRRQQTFFNEVDYQVYLDLMAEWCAKYQVETWAYCLMPNHVPLVVVAQTADGLTRAIGEAHRRYSRHVNFRQGWRGHLWQGRFSSFVLDQRYLLACVRYVELNPVRAGLVDKPDNWRWSSASNHIRGEDNTLVKTAPMTEMINTS